MPCYPRGAKRICCPCSVRASRADSHGCCGFQMSFVTDLLCVIPVSTTINDTIQTFKFDCLNVLFDCVIELQLARKLDSK